VLKTAPVAYLKILFHLPRLVTHKNSIVENLWHNNCKQFQLAKKYHFK